MSNNCLDCQQQRMAEEACPFNQGYCLECCLCPLHMAELDLTSYSIGHRSGIKTAIGRLEATVDNGDPDWDAFVLDAVAVIGDESK